MRPLFSYNDGMVGHRAIRCHVPSASDSPGSRAVSWLVVAILAPVCTAPVRGDEAPKHRTLFRRDSRFGSLEVTEADGLRYLFVDGIVQTAMYADRAEVPRECHLREKRYWLELLPYFRPKARRCLLIGLGGGLLPAVLEGYGVATHAVEIDPVVLEAARRYFAYEQPATIGDGRAHLERCADRFECIVVDAFAGAAVPHHLATRQCFELAKRRLKPAGVLALNIISRPSGSPVSASVARTLGEVFSHVTVYSSERSNRIQSLTFFASDAPLVPSLHPHGRELGLTADALESARAYIVIPSSAESTTLTDEKKLLREQWSKETAEWRDEMLELFRRHP